MKKSKFTEQRIAFALQQAEGGTNVAKVCRKMGVPEATFHRWKQLCGGLMPSEVKKLRQLEEENARLRKGARGICRSLPRAGAGALSLAASSRLISCANCNRSPR
jgi:putative transposase